MSNNNSNSIGEMIRDLRIRGKMPLRKLAALLDLDQSTLSKIEHSTRNANEQLLEKLAKIFDLDVRNLKIQYLSDKITYELKDKDFGLEVLKIAEEKLKYELRNR
ncbi:helix-turn-helix transcriptional regulator [candidate division KSB1 bacterium]|nr:helix-turn-helix transcriptional regulator [candidate division KSB1 bacterium]